jgi:hypothetical protein
MTRLDDHASVLVENAQQSHAIDAADPEYVTEVFEQLTDVNVRPGDGTPRELDDDAERRLEDLGYLR